MFVCEDCLKKYKETMLPFWLMPKSRGNCEDCGQGAVCADIHHSNLIPKNKPKKTKNSPTQ